MSVGAPGRHRGVAGRGEQAQSGEMSTPTRITAPTAIGKTEPARRRRKGHGSVRERRPGVWEVRVTTSPGQQRSITVHGDRDQAETTRHALIQSMRANDTCPGGPPHLVTVAELLAAWLAADHPWPPSTEVGYRSVARGLLADPIAAARVCRLLPQVMRQTQRRWQAAGVTATTAAGRFRTLRAAMTWGYDERILDTHPLRYTRGPGRTAPRRPVTDDDIRALITTAELQLLEAIANDVPGRHGHGALRRHRAELDLLLVRLAADRARPHDPPVPLRRTAGDPEVRPRALTLTPPPQPSGATSPPDGSAAPTSTAPPAAPGCSPPTSPTSTASDTASRPTSSPTARSCRPRPGSGTPTPPPPCASTPTPSP